MLNATNVKNLSIACFFLVLSWSTWDLHNFAKERILNIENVATTEIASLRTDTFDYLHTTTDRLDNRLSSIEQNTFSNIQNIRKDLFVRVDSIENKTFTEVAKMSKNVDDMSNTIDQLAKDYSKIPNTVENFSARFDVQTDCEINDLCWQNMTTDLLIDSRNFARDGTTTFRTVNEVVPEMTEDVSSMTSSISDATPVITDNVTKITSHVEKLTRPKWWHKAITWTIGAGGLVIAILSSN